jgi:hypothetical protein
LSSVRYTLVTDGASDRALLSVLDWFWLDVVQVAANGEWFDPRPFAPPTLSLEQSIKLALDLYPCEVLFIHRDAEKQPADIRYQQIRSAVNAAVKPTEGVPYVCVVPVRMTEAWLLFDETAIRRAAGNPNGCVPLGLPSLTEVERLPDPKTVLLHAIRKASGRTGRRLKKLNESECRARLAELIRDFSPLRKLDAFARLESDLLSVAAQLSARY